MLGAGMPSAPFGIDRELHEFFCERQLATLNDLRRRGHQCTGEPGCSLAPGSASTGAAGIRNT
jgi:hypothetical protein